MEVLIVNPAAIEATAELGLAVEDSVGVAEGLSVGVAVGVAVTFGIAGGITGGMTGGGTVVVGVAVGSVVGVGITCCSTGGVTVTLGFGNSPAARLTFTKRFLRGVPAIVCGNERSFEFEY